MRNNFRFPVRMLFRDRGLINSAESKNISESELIRADNLRAFNKIHICLAVKTLAICADLENFVPSNPGTNQLGPSSARNTHIHFSKRIHRAKIPEFFPYPSPPTRTRRPILLQIEFQKDYKKVSGGFYTILKNCWIIMPKLFHYKENYIKNLRKNHVEG